MEKLLEAIIDMDYDLFIEMAKRNETDSLMLFCKTKQLYTINDWADYMNFQLVLRDLLSCEIPAVYQLYMKGIISNIMDGPKTGGW